MIVLVCNAGSTSLKFKLYDMPAADLLATGKVERVGSADDARNEACCGAGVISAGDSAVCVRVIPANEELGVARRTYELREA